MKIFNYTIVLLLSILSTTFSSCTKEKLHPSENGVKDIDKFLFCTVTINGKEHTNYGFLNKSTKEYEGIVTIYIEPAFGYSSSVILNVYPWFEYKESGTLNIVLNGKGNGSDIKGDYMLSPYASTTNRFEEDLTIYFVDENQPYNFKITGVKDDPKYGKISEGEFSFQVYSLTRTTHSPVTGKFRAILRR